MNLEHAYIGQVLQDNRVLWLYNRISQADLSDGNARQVLDAIESVIRAGHRADLVSVVAWLREHGRSDLTAEIAGWTSLDAAPASLVREIKQTALRRAYDRSGVEVKAPFKIFRHTFASRLVMAGVDAPTIARLLGHTTLAVTDAYMHMSPGHLHNAMEKLEVRQA